jgi:hypothetical protein
MKLLCRVALVLILTFGVGIGMLRALAVQQAPPLAALFTNPDGSPCEMPCMLGVRPDITDFYEADQILSSHPLIRSRFRRFSEGANPVQVEYVGKNMRITLTRSITQRVNSISLAFESVFRYRGTADFLHSEYLLGDVVSVLGPPDLLTYREITATENWPWIYYPAGNLVIINYQDRQTNRVDPNIEAAYFLVMSPDQFKLEWQEAVQNKGTTPWLGFATLSRYLHYHAR